jgi:large subunit ribosomal protein L32
MRASHHAIAPKSLSTCSRCSYRRPPHRVCPNCGYYDGREVVSKEDES